MKTWKRILALCLVLVMCLTFAACGKKEAEGTDATVPADGSTLGQGVHSFSFHVELKDGTAYTYTVNTDQEILGDALVELGLIAGENGDYGLYVTTVLGETLDYEADGYWWSLSENGESSMVGVDSLTITDGSTYAFVATPA